MGLMDVIGAVFSGGATGLIGIGVNAFLSFKKAKEENRHKEEMLKLNSEAMRAEAELELEKIRTEGDIQQNIESTKAFAESLARSYEHDKAAYFKGKQGPVAQFFFGLVDVWRGLIRPGLTTYLVVLTSMMYWTMLELVEKLDMVFSEDKAIEIIMMIVALVLYLTSTCVTWWFGGRQLEKFNLLR